MKIIKYLSAILFGFLIALPIISEADAEQSNNDPASYLYVLNIESGSYDGKELYLIASPKVIFFSDRPVRKAGYMTLKKFIRLWKTEDTDFINNPPNALLSIFKRGGGQNVVLELELTAFKYSSMRFKATILQGTLPKSFKEASLFIDDVESSDSIENLMH